MLAPTALAVAVFLGCPRASVPDGPAVAIVSAEERARQEALTALSREADAVAAQVKAFVRARDEALWRHWTTGAALDLDAVETAHAAAISPAALASARRALEAGAGNVRRQALLVHFIEGEQLARATAAASATVANLEASLVVQAQGRDVRWSVLERTLAAEPSAVTRRALWTASVKTAERLVVAVQRRDGAADATARTFGAESALAWAEQSRELSLAELAVTANQFLERTELHWRAALERRAASQLKLPVAQVTRADLPRLVRPPVEVDALFPKDALAPRLEATLTSLGLWPRPGLTLDLADSVKKQPLPLTVAPGAAADVRTSLRPLAGVLDSAAALGEVGAALALSHAATSDFVFDRLGDATWVQASSGVFSGLNGNPAWLQAQGLTEADTARAAEAQQVHRLYALRRAAGRVLVWAEASEDETQGRATWRAVMSRALGVPLSDADAVRWRLEREDLPRSAARFRAALLAAALEATLQGETAAPWWQSPSGLGPLQRVWAAAGAAPAEATLGAPSLGLLALVRGFGEVPVATDAGVAPWPRPKTLATDGGAGASDGKGGGAVRATAVAGESVTPTDGGVGSSASATPDAGR